MHHGVIIYMERNRIENKHLYLYGPGSSTNIFLLVQKTVSLFGRRSRRLRWQVAWGGRVQLSPSASLPRVRAELCKTEMIF